MRYFFLSGSLRKDSINTKLLHWAASHLGSASSAIAKLNDLAIPLYNADIQAIGIPDGVQQLASQITQSDALVIASPEYNYSISGVLKNTIDWLSRVSPMPLAKKPILLMAASPGQIAGIRGLWQTRIPFEGLGNYVYPEMFGLGNAFQTVNEQGFVNSDDQQRFVKLLEAFSAFAKDLSGK